MMPTLKAILLLSLVLGVLSGSLTITDVMLSDQSTTSNLVGSIMGGTKLYIKGLGFSKVMSENNIFVGNFLCNLEDGATDTTILCTTSAAIPYKEYNNLEITVSVTGVGTATAPKKFSYVAGQTPVLYTVYPSVSYGGRGTKLSLYGIPRINNLGADKDQGTLYNNSR